MYRMDSCSYVQNITELKDSATLSVFKRAVKREIYNSP